MFILQAKKLNSYRVLHRDQSEIKSTISEIKITLGGINIRLVEAVDQISDLEDNVEKSHQVRSAKRKKNYLET